MTTKALQAIDTNVILRYLLRDNEEQWERSKRLIDSDHPLGLTMVVLAETAWTLTGPRYSRDPRLVAPLLIELLARENIVCLGFDALEAESSLLSCATEIGAADFGDALVAACARSVGVHEIYSFDRRFARAGLEPFAPE